jgi:hypothetical protein
MRREVILNRRFGITHRSHLQRPRCPRRWGRYVDPKRRFPTTSRRVITQKTEEISSTAAKTYDPGERLGLPTDRTPLYLVTATVVKTTTSQQKHRQVNSHRTKHFILLQINYSLTFLPHTSLLQKPRTHQTQKNPTDRHRTKPTDSTLSTPGTKFVTYRLLWGYAEAQLVEALRYKPGSRRFDSRCSLNPSGRTMALGSTQLLTETSTRDIPWG